MAPQPEDPTPPGTVARITVGGPSNRWLNISQIELVGGADNPDSKIFMCEVCIDRGTPSEVCNTANYTNRVIGGPPVINVTRSKNRITCMNEIVKQCMRSNLCMPNFSALIMKS